MVGTPSIVPEVGCRALIAPVSYDQWLLGAVVLKGYIGGDHLSICSICTFKNVTLVIFFYDRNHLHPVSLLALIEVESEHTNTTSVEDASDAPLLLCLRSRGVLSRTHHKDGVPRQC